MSTMNAMDRKAYFLWKKDQNIPERVIAEAQKDAAEEAQLRLEAEEKAAEAQKKAAEAEERIAQLLRQVEAQRDGSKEV